MKLSAFYVTPFFLGLGLSSTVLSQESAGPLRPQVTHCTVKGSVAPTFDDGISSENTPQLLDILAQQQVKLTFFLVGQTLEDTQNEATLRRMLAEGHHIAMHSFTHANLTALTAREVAVEVLAVSDRIAAVLGPNVRPRYFRCPFGDCQGDALSTLEALGLEVIHWSGDEGDTNDWREEFIGNKQHVVEVFNGALEKEKQEKEKKQTQEEKDEVERASPSIFLLHDLYPSSVQAAEEFIPMLQLGYGKKVTTVADCLGDSKLYYTEEEWAAIVAKMQMEPPLPSIPAIAPSLPSGATNETSGNDTVLDGTDASPSNGTNSSTLPSLPINDSTSAINATLGAGSGNPLPVLGVIPVQAGGNESENVGSEVIKDHDAGDRDGIEARAEEKNVAIAEAVQQFFERLSAGLKQRRSSTSRKSRSDDDDSKILALAQLVHDTLGVSATAKAEGAREASIDPTTRTSRALRAA